MKGRVLVVDDDPSLGEMLGIVLRQEGFEPVFVRSGDQAIAAFHQAKPDLVLLDLMLPGKDGLEICRELRLESGVPIVMLTAKTDTVDVVLGLESGADDYITKPFSAKELVARIRARPEAGQAGRRAGQVVPRVTVGWSRRSFHRRSRALSRGRRSRSTASATSVEKVATALSGADVTSLADCRCWEGGANA